MPIVFLLYSNSRLNPLPGLREEDERVYNTLSPRRKLGHFAIHRESYTSVDSMVQYLNEYREEIILFSFSGHAGKDRLVLEEGDAKSEGIAGLLSRCPKLKLVLLNGCSTAGQVDRLLELPSQPVVIATSAPVGDHTATKFAIQFFQEMGARYANISEAFESGMNVAKTYREHPIEEVRMLALRDSDKPKGQPGWGIYASNAKQLKWKLPTETDSEVLRQQSVAWLKAWGIYQLIGLALLTATLLLQLPSNPLLLALVPIFFYIAPFPATLRTYLPRKRLYLLTGMHALLYFFFLFLWLSNDKPLFFLFFISGLCVYFFILPLVSQKTYPKNRPK